MKIFKVLGMSLLLMVSVSGFHSCDPLEIEAGFEDLLTQTIYDYMVENDSMYSSFLSILKSGGIDKTLSAYNPNGLDYTLFLPGNEAIDEYISHNDHYASLAEMLDDTIFTQAFSRYHVVNMGIKSDDFPFGALPEYTLSGDLLTISFILLTDTSYYKINNQAAVIEQNIEVSNGYVHIIEHSLLPVTKTTRDWLEQNGGYSIFWEAVEATGFGTVLDIDYKEDESEPVTLLLEHDSVFEGRDIYSFDDLAAWISPDDNNYTDLSNPLYSFIGYHILEESWFLDDFSDAASNYTNYSSVPVNINGIGLDIIINPTKEVFDTIIVGSDTTIIDFIGFNYDASNVLTQSGAIHFIDQVLRKQTATPATQTFEFWDEPLLNEYRQTPGDYLIEDTSALYHFTWFGTDLYFVETGDPDHSAWGGDYLYMDGDFIIQYEIPKIVAGIYTVVLRAETLDENNALIEVFIDGKKIGGLLDLSSGGNANYPFRSLELGTIDLLQYEEHTIEIRSLIPGKFSWDMIRFEPYVEN